MVLGMNMKRTAVLMGALVLTACASPTKLVGQIDGVTYKGQRSSMQARHKAESSRIQRINVSSLATKAEARGNRGIEQMTFRVAGADEIGILRLTVEPSTDEILEIDRGFDLRYLRSEAPEEVELTVEIGRKETLTSLRNRPELAGTVPAAYARYIIDVTYVGGDTEHLEAPLCFEGIGSDEELIRRNPIVAVRGPRVACAKGN